MIQHLFFCYVEIVLSCTISKKERDQQLQDLITSLYTADDVGVTKREMTLREHGVSRCQGDSYRRGSVSTGFSFES